MRERPDYFKEAVAHPYHRALVVALVLGGLTGLWQGSVWPLLLLGALEAAWLLLVPRLPAFRAACDREHAAERARREALDRERASARLSPDAKGRLDSFLRSRQRILDGMRALPSSDSLLAIWGPRLEGMTGAALRILLALDAHRADDRDRRFLEGEVRRLESELSEAADGPAKQARGQRLELASRRLSDFARVAERREAAVVQLETLEDLLQDLLSRPLADRDTGAFGRRVDLLQAQIDAAGESLASLERHSEVEGEYSVLNSTR